jgi:hypothetical protein
MSFSSTRQIGLPAGGLTGQALVKLSNNDFDVAWGTGTGTGGTVLSVFGRTGVIVPQSGDYNSDLVPEQVGANNLYFTNTRARAVFSNTAPINYSAGVYSITLASTSANGYISSTDWTTFNSKGTGTVTSVGLTVPSWLTVSAPVTTTGTLAITATSGQTANQVMATPDEATGAMSLRALGENDIPNLDASKITSGYLNPTLGGGGVPFYGDGSDGNVTINSFVGLTRDMYYNNLSFTANFSINNSSYRIFVAGILDITNTTTGGGIANNGNAGSNASGATGGTFGAGRGSNTVGGSNNGTAGSTATTGVGTQATAVASSVTTLGGLSGTSGAGGGLGAVGTAGRTGTPRTDNKMNFFDVNLLRGQVPYTGGQSGPGGTAGNGNGTSVAGGGGGGGSAGGIVAIFANIIKRDSTTTSNFFRANGFAGGNGGNAVGGGGGGGGSGAAGGCVYIVYNSLQGSTGTNIISASGGAGGNGGIGSVGYYGGTGGTGAGSGRIILINASTGVVTEYDGTTVSGSTAAAPTGTAGTVGGAGAILQVSL